MQQAMARRVAQLVRHVDVKPLANCSSSFVGRSVDLGWGRVYGGQTMAQGLAAAQHVAGPSRNVHHISCLFLRGGDTKLDIQFECDTLTSGRSFSAFHVRALQDRNPILAMHASFQVPEDGLSHTIGGLRPEWGTPSELRSLTECMAPYLANVPSRLHSIYTDEGNPLDLRPAGFVEPWDPTEMVPQQALWIRAKAPLPDDDQVHQRILAYISDWGLLATALRPHPVAMWLPEMQLASLSHSVHFHHRFRIDEQWICYYMQSPVTSGGRGYALGEFWSDEGVLVASTAQEGLMRQVSGRTQQHQQG